jgi:site-specific DNA-cytosine methylase
MGILAVDPDSMTEEQASQLENQYYKKYGGPHKRGRIVITGANMDWKQIGMSAVDMNIIESQKFTLRDLCNIYQINSALLNDPDNKVYNNVKEARKALYYEKVLPELDTFRDELNRWLVSRYNEKTGGQFYIDYDLESVPALQADMKAVMEQVKDAWWLTGSEKREAMGYDYDPVMDQFFVPAGLLPLGATQETEKQLEEYAVKRTFTDYPQSAVNTAKRAIEYTEENPNDCATQVGKVRASQIANKEPLSYDTVKRTYSFLSRAKEYDTGSFEEADGNPVCGSISYAYWGGDSMRRWAEKKINEIENA